MIQTTTVAPCSAERPRSDTASFVEMDDGRLLIAYHGYRAGPEGGGDFGAAVIFFRDSADSGLTWSDERLVLDNDDGDVNAPNRCFSGSRTTSSSAVRVTTRAPTRPWR